MGYPPKWSVGGDVMALYPAGGVTGHLVDALLAAETVPAAIVAIRGETRESFSVHERRPGPQLAASEWQACLDRALALAGDATFFVASDPVVAIRG